MFDQGQLAVASRRDVVDLVRLQRLGPENVARMIGLFVEALGRMAVEDWPAKRDMLGRMAVATNRQVPAGHHQFEFVAARMAEDGDALMLAVAAGIVLKLFDRFA